MHTDFRGAVRDAVLIFGPTAAVCAISLFAMTRLMIGGWSHVVIVGGPLVLAAYLVAFAAIIGRRTKLRRAGFPVCSAACGADCVGAASRDCPECGRPIEVLLHGDGARGTISAALFLAAAAIPVAGVFTLVLGWP